MITTSRLVTLTGAGGAGKTHLGLQVAAGLLDGSGDGVWFADLAPLQDADLVAVTVANVLGIPEDPGRPVIGTLAEAVGQRSLLILLDNCEHVLGACAKLADALLRNCPNIVLLATSREPLAIDGERVHRVPSLDTPADGDDMDAIRTSEAVRLFADRAAQHGVPLAWDKRTASVVGRVCRRLDGIPLAIELGAARLRVMSVTELDDRLDQRFALLTGGSRAALPRQQTLRAMVNWSWELLNAAERHVLARLSVFAGGFDLAAVEAAAAGEEVLRDEVVGLLGALVNKSLVQFDDTGTGPVRYRLLETVRQYAAWQLEGQNPVAAERPDRASQPLPDCGEAAAPTWWHAIRASGWSVSIWNSASRCRDRLQPDAGGPCARHPAGRLLAGVLEGTRARHRSSGGRRRSLLHRPRRRRRCCAPGPWPAPPTSLSRPAATPSPSNAAMRHWRLPGPPGTTTW